MNIIFKILTKDDAITIYQSYLHDKEPDSPTTDFSDLSEEKQEITVSRYKDYIKVIIVDDEKVGWITVIDKKDNKLNLGYSLFNEFRGKGLMAKILIEVIPKIKEKSPGKIINASTRRENIASLKTLRNAGFKEVGTEKMPLIGDWKEPIEYIVFSV